MVCLFVICLVSCGNNDLPNTPEPPDLCTQLLDSTGLKLYLFSDIPFSVEDNQYQIPEDFLHEMTTKELFYQIALSIEVKGLFIVNVVSFQLGFWRATQMFNAFPELLNRPDAGIVLLELLQKVKEDVSATLGPKASVKCYNWIFHLEMFLAQPEVINRMTDEEIDNYIYQQMCYCDAIHSYYGNDNPYTRGSIGRILFGLGNVMIRYEYEPFMQLLETNRDCADLMSTAIIYDQQTILLIIDCINNFKNRLK